MAKKETVHDRVFEIYDLKKDKGKHGKIRKFIARCLKAEFPEKNWGSLPKDWDALSDLDKARFLNIVIKDKMLEKYVDSGKRKRIDANIDKYLNDTMYQADIEIKQYNENILNIHKKHYEESDSHSDKKIAYDQFRQDLSAINKLISMPSYDEWIERNKIKPFSIYDYCMDDLHEMHRKMETEPKSATQSEINDKILKTIMRILSTEFNYEIDVSRIKEAISYTKDFHKEDFEDLLIEYNPDLPLNKDEQNDIIESNKKYMTYSKMLRDLDFYK